MPGSMRDHRDHLRGTRGSRAHEEVCQLMTSCRQRSKKDTHTRAPFSTCVWRIDLACAPPPKPSPPKRSGQLRTLTPHVSHIRKYDSLYVSNCDITFHESDCLGNCRASTCGDDGGKQPRALIFSSRVHCSLIPVQFAVPQARIAPRCALHG